jgi:hypothetical protein
MMYKQYATRYTLYAVVRSTLVENSLQIHPYLCETNPISEL